MSKDLNLLNPRLQYQFQLLQGRAKEKFGLTIICTQTLRTEAEQNALYAQGRKTLDEVNNCRKIAGMSPITDAQNKGRVTNAEHANQSWHGFGLAFDIAVVSPDGKHIIWDKTADWNADGIDDWTQVGSLADDIGLEWGGNFTSITDVPHYQNRMGMTLAQAQAKYNK